jgi:hypothetical protein
LCEIFYPCQFLYYFSLSRLINPRAADSAVERTGGNKTGEDPDYGFAVSTLNPRNAIHHLFPMLHTLHTVSSGHTPTSFFKFKPPSSSIAFHMDQPHLLSFKPKHSHQTHLTCQQSSQQHSANAVSPRFQFCIFINWVCVILVFRTTLFSFCIQG